MVIACCGSRDWLDMDAVRDELEMVMGCYNAYITLVHRGNKGVDRIVDWQGKNLGFKVKKKDKLIDSDTDLLLYFQKNGFNGDSDLLSLAKEKSIPIKIVRGY